LKLSLGRDNIGLVTRKEITEAVKEVLKAESTMALATVDGNGVVSSAPVFYSFDQRLQLYWLSSSASRHSRNIAGHPQAAASVYPSIRQWTEIRGVQIEGTASVIADPAERSWVIGEYVVRFRLRDRFHDAIEKSTLYRLRPAWVRYLDNSRGFGYSAETAL